jgi:hypothetical protein
MPTIALTLLKEILLAMIAKVGWRIVAERFITRVVVWGLQKLASMTTNAVATETVQDILQSLQGKDLDVIEKLTKK